MGRRTSIAGLTLAVLAAAAVADAQVNISFGGRNGGSISIGGGSGFRPGYRPNPYRPTVYPRPSRPVIVTDHEITRYNPWTGQIDTKNTQINDTAFDYGRDASQYNGTRRYVRRPVTDRFGNITGYEEGWVWNNSLTGQEHADLKVRQINNTGGTSETHVLRSVAPSARGNGTTQP
ncbi:hypothetical protein Pla108_15520 [Botrimarina colliarenosi]|uniref:Uncharacterized protein n=1 Tax=Botrimarina colliarenosi TaxID=2528001 RepID=A0A5C6ALT8_9BACT|nr:hypothetical protein [Botrimarina colliarenosi]TWU00600.1 hypothetical protein Pla108_15520 [Botrimarina colliarenosi]